MQVDVKEIADPSAPLLIEIKGVTLLLKKKRGKNIDIKPPVNNSRMTTNETVAEMLGFPEIRSESGIYKETVLCKNCAPKPPSLKVTWSKTG